MVDTIKSNVTSLYIWPGSLSTDSRKGLLLLDSPSKDQRTSKWQSLSSSAMKCLREILLIQLKVFLPHTPQPWKQIKNSRAEALPRPTVQSQTQTNSESWAFWSLYLPTIFTCWFWLQLILTREFSLLFWELFNLQSCQSFMTPVAPFMRTFLACQHQIFCEYWLDDAAFPKKSFRNQAFPQSIPGWDKLSERRRSAE